ncbi:MAG TPA: hypothetical protein V6C65_38655 [Allocoleopsis sp.]
MKKIISLAMILFSATAFAIPVKVNQSQSVDYNASIETGYTYDLVVSSGIVPLKVFSAIALNNPVSLKATCDGVNIGQASMLYDASIKGNSLNLVFTVKDFERKCKSRLLTIELIPNGVELDVGSPWFTSSPIRKGQTFEKIKSTRATKSLELVKIMKGLSSLGGSKAAFYCLIKEYDSDPLMSVPSDPSNPDDKGIIQSMKDEYAKFYGLWDDEKAITCPIDAKGALAKNVKACEEDPSDLSPFCLIYDRYLKTRAWYYESITRLQQLNAEPSDAAEAVKIEIEELAKNMDKEIKEQDATLRTNILTN